MISITFLGYKITISKVPKSGTDKISEILEELLKLSPEEFKKQSKNIPDSEWTAIINNWF